MHRPTLTIVLALALASTAAAHTAPVDCADERFVAGDRSLPTHAEALAQCRDEELAMTDPRTGAFEAQRSCYDVTPPGMHGDWRHGRIAVDVVERRSGDAYTFEALWMCKPVN